MHHLIMPFWFSTDDITITTFYCNITYMKLYLFVWLDVCLFVCETHHHIHMQNFVT